MSHHKRAPDALVVTDLTIKDNPAAVKTVMRDGWYLREDGTKVIQSMSNNLGQQKGLRSILEERGKWRNGMPLRCKPFIEKIEHCDRAPGTIAAGKSCCAKYCLSQEPDFLEQREWLTEIVQNQGCQIIFYPKYHCELNFIERLWGYLKGRVRKECDYSFPSLCHRVPQAIENIPINFVQKSFRMCFRIMSMYDFGEGLEGPLLDYANRKYKSHRRVPSN